MVKQLFSMMKILITKYQEAKGKNITLNMIAFPIPNESEQHATIIRCTNQNGLYIVGCRFDHDNKAIEEFVKQNYKEI